MPFAQRVRRMEETKPTRQVESRRAFWRALRVEKRPFGGGDGEGFCSELEEDCDGVGGGGGLPLPATVDLGCTERGDEMCSNRAVLGCLLGTRKTCDHGP